MVVSGRDIGSSGFQPLTVYRRLDRNRTSFLQGVSKKIAPTRAHMNDDANRRGNIRRQRVAQRQILDVTKAECEPEIMGWTVPAPQWKNTGRNREWCDDDYNDRT
jgi:hypothetical protein